MRPKHLKFPFTSKSRNRSPLLAEGVLHIPRWGTQQDDQLKKELERIFFSPLFKEIAIEYCSGNGTWVAEKARQNPEILWIAVEKRFDRVRKIWAKKHNFFLHANLLIVCGEALAFTKHYVFANAIDQVYINFPDPWPKERHVKHRIIQPSFLEELERVLKKGKRAVFVTDDESYSLQMIDEMEKRKSWYSSFPEPFYTTEWPQYGESYFDALWKQQGKVIRYLEFINEKEQVLV
jgi:tRNA (guanine-N7-)-methyltransferase